MNDQELVRIRDVEALDGFNVRLTFSDGSERVTNLKPTYRRFKR